MISMPTPQFTRYKGRANLPQKVYVDDTKIISLTLKPRHQRAGIKEIFRLGKSQRGEDEAVVDVADNTKFLEIELACSALTITEDRIKRLPLSTLTLDYRWSCNFAISGNHMLLLTIRAIDSSSNVRVVGICEHQFKVVRLDSLTQRQLWVWTALTGLLTLVSLAVIITLNITTLVHVFGWR